MPLQLCRVTRPVGQLHPIALRASVGYIAQISHARLFHSVATVINYGPRSNNGC